MKENKFYTNKILLGIKALLFLALIIVFTGQAQAVTYSGSLKGGTGGGITASDGWVNPGTIFSWTVQDIGAQDGFILWQYDYTFTGGSSKNISHLLIEVSPDSSTSDFTILGNSAPLAGGAALYDNNTSNVNMPDDMWALKFAESPADNSMSISFTTTHAPVWGDFYAKDGKAEGVFVTAWNSGFTASDIDSDAAIHDGTEQNQILRPDGAIPVVPEPISATLFLLGGAILGFRQFKKKIISTDLLT